MLGLDQIARLAAEEARREQQNRGEGGFGGRKPPLGGGIVKEKVDQNEKATSHFFAHPSRFLC